MSCDRLELPAESIGSSTGRLSRRERPTAPEGGGRWVPLAEPVGLAVGAGRHRTCPEKENRFLFLDFIPFSFNDRTHNVTCDLGAR